MRQFLGIFALVGTLAVGCVTVGVLVGRFMSVQP